MALLYPEARKAGDYLMAAHNIAGSTQAQRIIVYSNMAVFAALINDLIAAGKPNDDPMVLGVVNAQHLSADCIKLGGVGSYRQQLASAGADVLAAVDWLEAQP